MSKELNDRKQGNTGDWDWFNKFCGVKMASNYYTFHIFSTIFERNPDMQRIIELGQFTGSMSMALGMIGAAKQIPVHSFDIQDQTTWETKRVLKSLKVQTHIADIHNFMVRQQIIEEYLNKQVYLLCDNGMKKDEFIAFVPYLLPGSVVSVHDYGVEFLEEDWKMFEDQLEPFMPEEWNKHNVQLATWIKK